MSNQIFLFFFLILFAPSSFSQLIIKGNVKANNGAAIANASVTLYKYAKQEILAFAITDDKGNCSITWQSPILSDSLQLTVSAIGYGEQTISFFPQPQNNFSFTLSPQAIQLPSVTVKNNLLKLRGDTLNYDAKSFSQKQDMFIGDIIKRLPGIEVSGNGQIKYNGKPITNYYIEGLDLLEDKYSIANNNIPADAVDKVQVLENHQPIHALDSFAFSDRAALNIKLKQAAKFRLIGTAKAGSGFSNNNLLWDIEAVPMMFKKNMQFIDTYKGNNAGINNMKELTQQNIMDYINAIENNAVKNDILSTPSLPLPTIAEQRYLFNNQNLFSVNQLLPLNKFYQLRINADYVSDYQQQNSNTITKFYLPVDTIIINEVLHTNVNLKLLQTNFTVTANNPKFYFKNMLKFQGWWQKEGSELFTNTSSSENLKNPFFNVSNDFKMIKVKPKYIVEYASYIGNSSAPQSIEIYPGIYPAVFNSGNAYQQLQQNAALQTFYTDNYFSVKRKKSKISSDYKLGIDFQSQYFNSALFKTEQNVKYLLADSFQNHLYFNRYKIYNESQWSYDNTRLRISFILPFAYTQIKYHDDSLNVKGDQGRLFINPNVYLLFYLNQFWNINFSAGYSEHLGDINALNEGYVLHNYRNLSNNSSPLPQTKSGSISANIVYRNPLKIKFFNVGFVLSKMKSNILYSQQYFGSLQSVTGTLEDNYQNNLKFFFRYSKYFMALKTSAALGLEYIIGNVQQLQQSQPVKLTNQNVSIKTNLSSKISSKITISYAANYSIYLSGWQNQTKPSAINLFNQSLAVNIFPADDVIVKISGEHYCIQKEFLKTNNYVFSDISVRYKFKKARLDFELNCQNLFNTKNFTAVSFSNNIEVVSNYQIRPIQVLGKIYFTF